jgi:hypothetical protein
VGTTTASKEYIYLTIFVAFAFFFLIGGFSMSSFLGSESNALTTVVGTENTPLEGVTSELKTIPGLGQGTEGALFDIILTIPDQYRILNPGQEFLVSVELTNFGSTQTDAAITYIVTRARTGDIVYIENEDRTIYAQEEFLKQLQLQRLPAGKYKIYVHMLYGDAAATTSREFKISSS